ncbi:MAG TPA: VWA domain-containing protein, partial [Pirellulaceae bacterium]|nr:VWA domain-containing protein [Pirellulaceae bacterium]
MNGVWRDIERWLIGENLSADPGGLETSVQAASPVPPWLVLLLILATAGVMLLVYWNESQTAGRVWKVLLAGMRTALVGLVVLMLYGWTVQRHRTDLPDVVVILDDSASMGLIDQYDDASLATEIKARLDKLNLPEATRLNLARTLLLENDAALITQLSQRYNLRFYLAAISARAIGGERSETLAAIENATADQPASRLGNCLRDVLEAQRGRPTAAVIMLTDGITTEGKSLVEAAQYARRKTVPLFLVGLGSDRPARDLRLADLLVEEAVFVGDLINFDVKLVHEGFTGDAIVKLTREGDSAVLDERKVKLGKPGVPQAIRLTHRADKAGEYEYIVEVAPREGEANTDNNVLLRKVIVREETIRVLLVQAYPSFEFRFLKQMLLRELNANQPADAKAAGFRTVLQEADLEYVETDKTAERVFPVSRDELFTYDVLIFGDVNPALLSPSIMQNIYDFVTVKGGGVIFIAGPRYTPLAFRDTPLAPLLPMNLDTVSVPDQDRVITEEFRPRMTPLGRASPMLQLADDPAANEKLWQSGLAPIRWFASVPDLRPGVRVLAEHPTARTSDNQPLPIIALQFVGAGKVVFHATDETHRWRFRVGDVYFARYWIQTIRYLCRSRLLSGNRTAELTTDREQYGRGDVVQLRVRFLDDRLAPAADDGVTVVVQREGSERRSITLSRTTADRGVFEGSAAQLPEGQYRAWVAAPTLEGQPPSRQFSIVAPPGELARTQMDATELREVAKVSVGKFYRFQDADKLLDDLPRGRQVRIESLPPRPIWNAP